uniref:AlNc14C190G8427 protein n=1 Tax=Albugo laibachii Nc14 TaxID=890382 RepID=F0WPT5_9STRA|nr:AlNc14C190G8427 [Albugo laibachii Nc14]|eukprot:CCA23336.1 AlNc14C190G8427 [Albugo laibachii Nc14]
MSNVLEQFVADYPDYCQNRSLPITITQFIAEMCRGEQSVPDVERDKGRGNTKVIMTLLGRKNYSSEDLDAAVRAYAAVAKIGRVCNEYPGVPDRTIRHRANLLKNGVALRKPGPPPILEEKLEGGLRDW